MSHTGQRSEMMTLTSPSQTPRAAGYRVGGGRSRVPTAGRILPQIAVTCRPSAFVPILARALQYLYKSFDGAPQVGKTPSGAPKTGWRDSAVFASRPRRS